VHPNLPRDWLPPGKRAAVCFTIDDVHPAKSSDCYEAGGDLGDGALGNLERLLDKHPALKVTLFLTADWREKSPVPTRRLMSRIPWLRDRVYLADRWPAGTMRLDRHPQFVAYLKSLPRTDIAVHGLEHCHRGLRIPVEFQDESYEEIHGKLREIVAVFESTGIDYSPGMCPPGWNAPPALLDALADLGMTFVASARDIFTPISVDAVANMSGMRGVSLIHPQRIYNGRLLHIPANFHATSVIERAKDIIESGGLLSIKAHIVKNAMGHIAFDGLDEVYGNYLDLLLGRLAETYGDGLWWTSMNEIANRVITSPAHATMAN